MATADADEPSSSVAPLPLMLLIASPAALKEATPLGGSRLLQALAEQLLELLGDCSHDAGAVPAAVSPTAGRCCWRCNLRTKYYTANIRALMVQQYEPAKIQGDELLLHEPPEAVVFICSADEQQRLHEARRALTKASSQADSDFSGSLEPLPFMQRSFIIQQRQPVHENGQQLERLEPVNSNGNDDWWVRGVPLKFLISLHCNASTQHSCCPNTNNCSTPQASTTDVETAVWNIGGDVFLEGLELCLVNSHTLKHSASAAESLDGAAPAAYGIAQQRHRLRKVAEAMHCHMWPGLSRLSTKASINNDSSCGIIMSKCHSTTSNCNSHSDRKNATGEATAHNTQEVAPQSKKWESESPRAGNEDEGPNLVDDAVAFDALAAAMLDLKQRGPLASTKDRRFAAMRLATQLAELTMCDED